jgi:hypothetical protein
MCSVDTTIGHFNSHDHCLQLVFLHHLTRFRAPPSNFAILSRLGVVEAFDLKVSEGSDWSSAVYLFMSKSGWRFNLGKIQRFKPLPKPINLHDSSSDDDIGETPTRKVRVPPVRIASDPPLGRAPDNDTDDSNVTSGSRLHLSAHSQLISQNYSSYSPMNQPLFGGNTLESLKLESQRMLVERSWDRWSDFKTKKLDLEAEYRRLKAENAKRLRDMRERLETTADKLEKNAGVLRVELKGQARKLNEARSNMEVDRRFVDIREKGEYIARTTKSFSDCQESVAALATILQYSPLAESEFDVITNTGSFDSPVGAAVLSFIAAAKQVLVKRQDEI